MPAFHSVAVLDIQALSPGLLTTQDQYVVFTYYPNASIEVRDGGTDGQDDLGKILYCRVQPAEGWTGFGMVTDAAPAKDATLRLRWRCTGTAPHVQIDVQERGPGEDRPPGEVFSAMVPFVFGQWTTTPLPLKNLIRNENYQPATAIRNGILDTDRLGMVDFTLPPKSDMTIEIADLTFRWPSAKWPVLGALLVGLLLLLMMQIALLMLGRLNVERTLKASEANYQAIFNAVGEGIWVLDPATGSTLDVNRTACEMLGMPRASMLGRPFAELAREFGSEDIGDAFQGGLSVPVQEWECQIRNRGGRPFWSEVRATQTDIEEQKRLLVVMREITEKKEAEQDRVKLEQRLMQSQKMEALGQLAGGIAHDFNNILTGIILAAEVVLLKAGASAAMSSGIKQIKELAGRATVLTQQMLTFSRRHPLRPVPLHLNALVEHVLSMLRPLIAKTST